MAERRRELDQRFQGGHFEAKLQIEGLLFAPLRHEGNHMVIEPFLQLLNTDLDGGRDQHCGRPSDVYDTHRRTKLTALETISR